MPRSCCEYLVVPSSPMRLLLTRVPSCSTAGPSNRRDSLFIRYVTSTPVPFLLVAPFALESPTLFCVEWWSRAKATCSPSTRSRWFSVSVRSCISSLELCTLLYLVARCESFLGQSMNESISASYPLRCVLQIVHGRRPPLRDL